MTKTTKPKAIATSQIISSRNTAVSTQRQPMQRAIRAVYDSRNASDKPVDVSKLLDGLNQPAFAQLRRQVATAHIKGIALFKCGQCCEPVFLTAGEGARGDGSTGFFRHHVGDKACSWRTGETLRSEGSVQFGGNQEGERHRQLKQLLENSLRSDPGFSDIVVEQRVPTESGETYRQPDLMARHGNQLVAFEVQLARPSLRTVVEREAFYASRGIHLIWVTSSNDVFNLGAQAFRDLYFAEGGRIFAVDEASAQRSMEMGKLHLQELTIEPQVQPPYATFNVWKAETVGRNIIFMPKTERHWAGRAKYGQRLQEQISSFDPALVHRLRHAAAKGFADSASSKDWNKLSEMLGGVDFTTAMADGVDAILLLLLRIEILAHCQPDQVRDLKEKAHRQIMAILRTSSGRHWLALIELVAGIVPRLALFGSAEVSTAITALKQDDRQLVNLHLRHRRMLSALCPWLAFDLLAAAPKRKTVQRLALRSNDS
ncbi:hypothetical protein VW35_00240 [Devosia soli]|uniref:Competence protein n=1 Tax=Devosia soli TaxID=361041 RepID=A0A0F5LJU9_9HYPH|nr:DUF6035 family protein [Devosia soli]KKB82555.1 hypothetical protein VW35_00240 [Devosia soli]